MRVAGSCALSSASIHRAGTGERRWFAFTNADGQFIGSNHRTLTQGQDVKV